MQRYIDDIEKTNQLSHPDFPVEKQQMHWFVDIFVSTQPKNQNKVFYLVGGVVHWLSTPRKVYVSLPNFPKSALQFRKTHGRAVNLKKGSFT